MARRKRKLKFGSPAFRAKYLGQGRKKAKANPTRRRRSVHRHSRRRRGSVMVQRNPSRFMARRRRSSRNPNFVSGGVNALKRGLYALIGLVLARQVPQLALGAGNTGWMGYAANFATALAAGWVGSKFLGADAGSAILLGGGLYTVARWLGDTFSPVQQYLSLSGVGDPMALGDIQPGYFPLPVPVDNAGNPIIPRQIAASPAAAAAASGGAPIPASVAKAGTMSGVGSPAGRFGGRW